MFLSRNILWILVSFTLVSSLENSNSEPSVFSNCESNNGGCPQNCVPESDGYHCECFSGYKLLDSGVCEDIDECQVEGTCSQLCNNTKGSYKCSCLEGYTSELSNQGRCKAQLGHKALLIANGKDLLKKDLERDEIFLVATTENVLAIDYDFDEKLVVWSDNSADGIYSAHIDNGAVRTNIAKDNIVMPWGLAVDWIYKNVYWTDEIKHEISVTSLDGKLRKLLFATELKKPRPIAVNPLEGWMFWADVGNPAKIERAGMDGTSRDTIVSKGIISPHGLTIDFVSKQIFWADDYFNTLSSSNFDGSNVEVILSFPTRIRSPFALDVFEDWLYWTDEKSKSVYKIDKFTGEYSETVTVGLYSPRAVKVHHKYKQPSGENFCKKEGEECSYLCLPTPRVSRVSFTYICACPDGIIEAEKRKCTIIEKPEIW